ncbi:AAA domain family protein [Francisella philomiragia]|uniref:McrB family protein n=1 Tax=Francisella philomiragia TaxID=28110 RepID=UPI0005A5703E|nr:AAA family ATPase [Francisella philomiragia]AJI56449.1 AAA domain family protein [Francisella philomiragia]
MKYWVYPANSEFYDHENAFKKLGQIDWKNVDKNGNRLLADISKGDIVYIYSTKQNKYQFRCVVLDNDISVDDAIDDSEFYKKEAPIRQNRNVRIKLDGEFESMELPSKFLKSQQRPKKAENELVNILESAYSGNNLVIKNNRKEYLISATSLLDSKKQIILYGPAGTGKTYNTKNIIVNHAFDNVDSIDKKYKELQDQGRVQFVTFHQSFAYEDFIEGIKPIPEDRDVKYDVQDGIFKELCEEAEDNFNKSRLGEKDLKSEENYERLIDDFGQFVKEQAIEDNSIVLNNKAVIEDVDISENGSVKNFSVGGSVTSKQKLTRSIISRDIGSFIKGNIKTYSDVKPSRDSERGYHGNAIYYFYLYEKIKAYYENHKSEYEKNVTKVEEKNYYLIIDEINRGNISKIFGELITLLESNKRLGNKETELKTTLPYSKDKFGIPPNLYIIGTMNTSDKSIAHLDIALRRRFGFVEMLPSYDENIIKNEKCRNLLENLNQRIEILLDKDHLIGHSFFCGISENESNLNNKISTIMQNEIVPLLEEYFYGDYEKIQLVLAGVGYKLEERDIPEELKQYSSKEKLYGKLVKI